MEIMTKTIEYLQPNPGKGLLYAFRMSLQVTFSFSLIDIQVWCASPSSALLSGASVTFLYSTFGGRFQGQKRTENEGEPLKANIKVTGAFWDILSDPSVFNKQHRMDILDGTPCQGSCKLLAIKLKFSRDGKKELGYFKIRSSNFQKA